MEMTKPSILDLVCFIGGILLVVGVFLNWASLLIDFSGWSIATDSTIFDYTFVPYVCLAAGIITIILSLVALVGVNLGSAKKFIGLIGLILALVAAILCIVFTTQDVFDVASVGAGVWVCVVGGILVILPVILGFFGLFGAKKITE